MVKQKVKNWVTSFLSRRLASRGISVHRKYSSKLMETGDGKLLLDKAGGGDFLGRFREIVSDPLNLLIPRHHLAGSVSNGKVVLHNGLSVPVIGEHSYYGSFSDILIINRGVHEPLEEFVFHTVLGLLPNDARMLELGAYWGHYSMWLKSVHPSSEVHMVEPDPTNLSAGKANFASNGFTGNFVNALVGKGHFSVDDYLKRKSLPKIDILHSDIQGFELEMLTGASESFKTGKIDYCFVSTHSEALHNECMSRLQDYGYRIDVQSGFDNHTTSADGLIFACRGSLPNSFEKFQPLGRNDIVGCNPADILKALNRHLEV